ncbi:hypothetical protein ALC60_00120 [Trachymyrmex zeteki]|uniref:Uncharacterized protein n=1 Tax=Mycetomoellerius zeteki TaxID=64791 RepID=A0A151WGN9_9HYME|nr:hypothetical protein ALC60_14012 [Trachymyrmex zeteki]KYQ53593.1 hypothetical protein ALC60_00120 [Trachymyrmex zeteki]
MNDVFTYFKTEVQTFLIDARDIDKVPDENLFLEKFEYNGIFKGMETLEDQMACLKANYNFVEPVEIELGTRLEQTLNTETGEYFPKQFRETFQYVPIIKVLQLLLSNETIKSSIKELPKNIGNGLLNSFVDGESFKNHEFFQRWPNAIRIQLYYDDIVVNNPLGFKISAHKLGTFYYTIQNLPAHLNSYLELKKLESDNGVIIQINNEPYTLRASLAVVCADGLAAHQLFGLLSSLARYFCRLCLINREEFHSGIGGNYQIRNKAIYKEQVAAITANKGMETFTGVKENSALHSSNYFHCTSNYIFDSMHDLLEGICKTILKLILHIYICLNKYFTVDRFNSRVHMFKYGISENKNKPSANFDINHLRNLKDHSIKQTAMQTWCLIRTFPFLVLDLIPDDDEYLNLILLLNRIMEIVFALKLRTSILPYLEDLIEMHEQLFRQLFPEIKLINKLHYLSHYSLCIRQSGSLRHVWCMRFEAKHNMFKKHGRVCCNYKNLPKTMIRLCQISQCCKWGMGKNIRPKLCCTNGAKKLVTLTLSKLELIKMGFDDHDEVFCCKNVQFEGILYRIGLSIVLKSGFNTKCNLPNFGKIEEIVILENEEIFLWCQLWTTLYLHERLNAYHVQLSEQYEFIKIDKLIHEKPISEWQYYGEDLSYFVLRHTLL